MALELKREGDITLVTDAELIDGGDKDTTYEIRHITIEKHREVTRQYTKSQVNPRNRAMEKVTDWEKVADELLEFALAKWVGVTIDGQPVPCDAEHIALLDAPRREAILTRAGYNEIREAAEAKQHSFRPVASVR